MLRAIEIIVKIKQIHQDWVDCFEKDPGAQSMKDFAYYVGDVNHHKKYIEEYNEVIAYIEQLQNENGQQAERIKELEGDKTRDT